MTPAQRRDRVIVAGHSGDVATARAGLVDPDPSVRVAAIGALDRLLSLDDDTVAAALDDTSVEVRRRAVELAATKPLIDLTPALHDADPTVVEVAAWACGEREQAHDAVLTRLAELATGAEEPLVREAAAAALGAIGDERGLPAILHACRDKPAIRRRAVLALAPFEGPEVAAAIEAALADRDWQVRQAAEDLVRAGGELELPD